MEKRKGLLAAQREYRGHQDWLCHGPTWVGHGSLAESLSAPGLSFPGGEADNACWTDRPMRPC